MLDSFANTRPLVAWRLLRTKGGVEFEFLSHLLKFVSGFVYVDGYHGVLEIFHGGAKPKMNAHPPVSKLA